MPAKGVAVGDHARHPLGVEDAEPKATTEPGDDPEPDHHRDLFPPEQLEVVLERRHPEAAACPCVTLKKPTCRITESVAGRTARRG